jgi:glutamine amidotransferase-like uncharacterized protein
MIYDVRFSDSQGFTEDLGSGVSRVVISGGDGLKIASSIGPHGFAHLKGFIHRGGGYVGICAGAYLPLHSSIAPFDQFNLSNTKIENIDCAELPPGTSPRLAVRYGSCSVIHPVRGEVAIESNGKRMLAPIYGGPIFREPERDEPIIRFSGFSGLTEYQTDEARAREMMLGKPAGVRSMHGKGELVLLGPHLEHPRYLEANEVFLGLLKANDRPSEPPVRSEAKPVVIEDLAKSIGDLKVAILGLENRSFLVGNKLWDGSRFLELIGAIEKRAQTVDSGLAEEVSGMLGRARESLVGSPEGAFDDSVEGTDMLIDAARMCVENHFAVMRKNR